MPPPLFVEAAVHSRNVCLAPSGGLDGLDGRKIENSYGRLPNVSRQLVSPGLIVV
jgi:hypothetical protein